MNEFETRWSARQDQLVGNHISGVSFRRERRGEKEALGA